MWLLSCDNADQQGTTAITYCDTQLRPDSCSHWSAKSREVPPVAALGGRTAHDPVHRMDAVIGHHTYSHRASVPPQQPSLAPVGEVGECRPPRGSHVAPVGSPASRMAPASSPRCCFPDPPVEPHPCPYTAYSNVRDNGGACVFLSVAPLIDQPLLMTSRITNSKRGAAAAAASLPKGYGLRIISITLPTSTT